MPRRLPQLPQPRDAYIPFRGGLDLETSPWEVPPGFLSDSENYELAIEGGYVDVEGYERFDGQDKPSDAAYAVYPVTISGSVEVGDTIEGATSGATAVVIAIEADPSQLVVTKVSGTFTDSEDLEVSASVEATATGTLTTSGASTSDLAAQYRNLAADEYRDDIAAVPGEGSVLGGFSLDGTEYAFRNATGGATAKLYKSTSSGWSEVDLGLEIDFTSGSEEPSPGDAIEGGTSGATGIIRRVVTESGTWAGADAAGHFVLDTQVGTFQSENLNNTTASENNFATIAGDSTAIELQPGGTVRTYHSNFADPDGNERVYGCDGVNRGWEFDGTAFVPIDTGMTDDTPDFVIVHRQHLFFAFGPSLQHSGVGDPYSWSLLTGAAELVVDDTITALQREPGAQGGAALAVGQRNRIHILYGTSSSDWELIPYRDEIGMLPDTVQSVGFTMFLDDRGLTNLRTVQAFGNFRHSTMSSHIQRLINSKRGLARSSTIVRNKNQYRLFFSDGTGLYVTLKGDKLAGIMPVKINHTVTTMWSQERSDGTEAIFFGASDGFVYQMEKGTSFDGDDIVASLTLHYTNDNVRALKRFMHNVTIEARGSGYAEIMYTYKLGYGQSEKYAQPGQTTKEIEFSSTTAWDAPGAVWDVGFWDGRTIAPTNGLKLNGTAENIAFVIRKSSDYFSPVRMTGIHYRYAPRRPIR